MTADLDQEVRWVHPTEFPNPAEYLEGGEVILTAGLWLTAGTSPTAFVDALRRGGTAALGFGLTKHHRTVPDELTRVCERRELNLFVVPDQMPFIEIVREAAEEFWREREAPLKRALRRSERLVRAAGGKDALEHVFRLLAQDCRAPAWLASTAGEVLAGDAAGVDRDALTAELAAGSPLRHPCDIGSHAIFPVDESSTSGAVLVVAPSLALLTLDERAAIEQAVPYLGMILARHRALRESERRFAVELVDLIEAGRQNNEVVAARMQIFGLDPAAALVVLVCEAGDEEEVLEMAERVLRDCGHKGLVTRKQGVIVVIVNWSEHEDQVDRLASALHDALSTSTRKAAVGYSGLAPDADRIRRSLVEARHACTLARRQKGGSWASYREINAHGLLLELQDIEVVRSFSRAVLEPLITHDAGSQVSLIATLHAFLESGGRWRQTADALYIHVNTLRNRIKQVEELTGRDLSRTADRVDLYLALRASRE